MAKRNTKQKKQKSTSKEPVKAQADPPVEEIPGSEPVCSPRLWILLGIVLVAATVLRTYWIDVRPFHNDEGVNFYFLQQIDRLGYFPYSHENYHGPALFYLMYALRALFGDGELTLRLAAIIPGLLLLLTLLPFRRYLGERFVVFSTVLLTVSASQVYYSRYAIHEPLFVLASALVGFSLFLWRELEHPKWVYLSCLGLALLIATKETFIITLFCLFLSLIGLGGIKHLWGLTRKSSFHILAGLVLAVVVIVGLFTGGFRWAGGIREMFLAVPQWVSRNESDFGHFKAMRYYIDITLGTSAGEFLYSPLKALFRPLLSEKAFQHKFEGGERFRIGLEPIFYLIPVFLLVLAKRYSDSLVKFWRPFSERFRGEEISAHNLDGDERLTQFRLHFFLFMAIWTFTILGVYSFVDYKTPWLIINITFPASVLLALFFDEVARFGRSAFHLVLVLFLITVSVQLWSTIRYVFIHPIGKKNPYSYVHTHTGMIDLINDIRRLQGEKKEVRILVGVNAYWPLPYYLRDFPPERVAYDPRYDVDQKDLKFDVLILDPNRTWSRPGWSKKYYRLSDVQESIVHFRK